MSYIGNQPPDTGAYDVESFNGGGTSFTLKRAATTPSILLFIDGVRQTPTDAYSVSGTTLTTTATTPSGTDNVTVMFMGDVVDIGAPSDDTVSTAKIQDDAVTAAKLANSINTEIAANTAKVTNATHTGDVTGATALTIATDAVTTAKILDNNVTLAKLDDGTEGDILYYGASGAPTRLAKGAAGKVLKINSGATAPEWGTDAGGSLEFISSHTLNSAVSTWDFTNVFSADYLNYLVLITRLHPVTNGTHLMFRFGNADLSSTESQGSQCMWMNYNTGPSRTSITGTYVNGMQMTEQQSNGTAGMNGHVWCYAPFDSNAPTHASGAAQCYNTHGIGSYAGNWSGWYGASSSIPSFQLAAYSGNIGGTVATATVKIYGVADS